MADLLKLPDEVEDALAAVGAAPPAAVKPKPVAINDLKSAPKIDLSKTPEARIGALPIEQLKPLMLALGAGELHETNADIRQAQVELASMRLSNVQFERFGGVDWKRDLETKVVFGELPPTSRSVSNRPRTSPTCPSDSGGCSTRKPANRRPAWTCTLAAR